VSSEKLKSDNLLTATLEEPTKVEHADATMSGLLTEDISVLSVKANALENLIHLLSKNIKFHEFIREILLIMMKAVRSEAGSILEVNQQDESVFFRAAAGKVSEKVVNFVIPLGKGIVGHVVESRQPFVINQAEDEQQHLKTIDQATGFKARNMIAVPIVVRGDVYGVLELINKLGDKDYTQEDIDLLSFLSHMSSRIIEARMMISWSTINSKKK